MMGSPTCGPIVRTLVIGRTGHWRRRWKTGRPMEVGRVTAMVGARQELRLEHADVEASADLVEIA